MASKSNLVNLDAMIKREDFAAGDGENSSYETINNISVRDLTPGGLTAPILRKPDFQRETNHWTPAQVCSLIKCYVNGDLIPSVILWKSPSYLFVIDGGHRLSALKAWIEDDYGDGPLSHKMFGHEISNEQKKAAEKTRKLIKQEVGTWGHYRSQIENSDNLDLTSEQRKIITTITTRGFQVQWVQGDTDKAETSFFNINMKGTPLDELEELLLRNRKKPIPIAARAIIRAGKGHRYWSRFDDEMGARIENEAAKLHSVLFAPELKRPVKTLDLPLGGSKGIRTAIQVLLDFILMASRNQDPSLPEIASFADDPSGEDTITILRKASKLAGRITGNGNGSLGLHPAIYYYGPSGRHSTPMFLGTVSLVAKKLANNDDYFFKSFTRIRSKLETHLIENKDLMAMILQKNISRYRVSKYHDLLEGIISKLLAENDVSQEDIIEISGLEGKILAADIIQKKPNVTDEEKSKVFINVALKSAITCPICNGYLDAEKSVSYDHIERVREGGTGAADNVQLTHPYCNQSVKN
ncbi:GmrSD restriction endonuclease domain-containing protein [Persicirhabdus sediminis]|uniref:DUF262 domain-containing protein n=1 Tax=Persicirhabdus sediminis TaxID=454144 RepID=A0A8J7MAQ7_9BACT|nr:DUF262 domain-containing protein [Persicirhabdus sediminis]MBK1790059.1 DUF262 domain-containing protein [Persicirhabdus sediminis]